MNKNILYAIMAGATTIGLASCDENGWNNHFLDGFEEGVDYDSSQKGSYTITADNYGSISKLLQSEATTDAEKAEAKAIGTNLYFSKNGAYPAQTALIPFLNTSSFPYYLGGNGTTVDVTFKEASDVPAELTALAAAKTYTVTDADYAKVWGNSTVYIKSFAPDATAASNLPGILSRAFTGEEAPAEGTYAVVTYNTADQNPMFQWDDAAPTQAVLYADNTFKAGKYIMYGEGKAAKIIPPTTANGKFAYFLVADVTVEGSTLYGYVPENVFEFTETDTPDVYYLGDGQGHYYYGDAKYNNFYIWDSYSDEEKFKWTVTKNEDGTWKVANVLAEKWIQYSAKYDNWGEYNYESGPLPVLYVLEDAPEPTGKVAYTPTSTTVNAVYYYNGSAWSAAEGILVLNPADYTAMGASNNNLSDEAIYIPMYLKNKLPYAQAGAEQYVVYNGTKADIFVYDGSAWSLNNIGLEEVVGRFEKKNGEWKFVKYIGKAIFDLYDQETITLERSYLIVADGECAMPIKKGSTFGYPEVTKVTINGTQIVEPSDANAFLFTSTYEKDGQVYTAPAGKFIIVDGNGRYCFMGGPTRQNVNVSNEPTITDGVIADTYIWEAKLNSDGTWSLVNYSDDLTRTWMYSVEHTSYGVYKESLEGRVLPTLYMLAE